MPLSLGVAHHDVTFPQNVHDCKRAVTWIKNESGRYGIDSIGRAYQLDKAMRKAGVSHELIIVERGKHSLLLLSESGNFRGDVVRSFDTHLQGRSDNAIQADQGPAGTDSSR